MAYRTARPSSRGGHHEPHPPGPPYVGPGGQPPGTDEPHGRQPHGHEPHSVSRPRSDGLAGRFIQHLATGASVAAGQNRAAPTTTNSRRLMIAMSRLLPHTVQLCIHCRQNPAGFWVSRASDRTVRRPWCLSCCQHLDPACHHLRPFDLPLSPQGYSH